MAIEQKVSKDCVMTQDMKLKRYPHTPVLVNLLMATCNQFSFIVTKYNPLTCIKQKSC